MATINPYLNFNGNTEEAFNFYRSVFGGEFAGIQRFKDTPEADKLPEEDRDKIMHIALPIGKNMIMATDALESMGQNVQQGNNFYITVSVDSEQEAKDLFNKLSNGGKIEMELQKTFWAENFGMFRDKFGVQWMVDHSKQQH